MNRLGIKKCAMFGLPRVRSGFTPMNRSAGRLGVRLAVTLVMEWSVFVGGTCVRADDPGPIKQPHRIRAWRAENGLPLSQIKVIAQSADGYLWLGAPQQSLFRFDGTRFSAPGDNHASPSKYPGTKDLTALLSGSDDALWVGTSDGLWKLSGGEWTHMTTQQGLSNNNITAIRESPNHDVWVGTEQGLNRIRRQSIRVFQATDGLSDSPINALCCDRAGNVWAGTRAGELYRLTDDHFIMIPRAKSVIGDEINAILEGRDGSLWIGKWNGGLTRFRAGSVRVYGPQDGLSRTDVYSLAEDRWGSIWIGTRRGLFVLPAEAQGASGPKIERISTSTGSVFSLLRDREGSIWAGTVSGLDQYKDWRLRVYSEREGLADRNVVSTFAARDGGLWVGMNGGGLARFRHGKIVATYGVAQGLPSEDVTSVCESRTGTVWIGHWGEGLQRLENDKFTPVVVGNSLNSGVVRSIYEDHAGDIWVGTWGNGLLRFHGEQLTDTYTTHDGLADDQVRVIEEDRAGNLWIATHGGLSQFRNGKFTKFTLRDGLSEDSIFALRAGDDGSLWIGTWGGGLNRLRDGQITSYTNRDGLPCDTICEILDDGRGSLWMSSVKGIFQVRKAELDAFDRGTVRTINSSSYDTDDGMNSAQCNRGTQPSGCRTTDGRLWFATISGMVMLDPTSLPVNPVAPAVFLEQVRCDDRTVPFGTLLKLPAARREIELRYTATCLLASEKVRFRYKMDGYNVDWIEAGHGREARYPNLPPGSYKFIVSACNGDGLWGPATELLQLSITPPFYQTIEFLSVCGVLLLGSAGAAYRLWTARLRARERELVVLVECRTAEARAAQAAAERANQAKDRFLAVLSHELRTPLTPVLLSIGCLLEDEKGPGAREQLEMIRRNVELEARLVDDLLDISRIERDRLKLDFELVDVHLAIARAAEICTADVNKSGLKIIFDLRAQSHHARADQARLIQVFWNLIRNAVKFASPDGTLTIRTNNEKAGASLDGGRILVVEFQDTGIGIEPDMLEKIFDPFEQGSVELHERRGGLGLGLAIGRAVAQAHGGRLTARSSGRKQGSTFRLELAALAAPKNEAGDLPLPDMLRQIPAHRKILLVEDNADALRYLAMVLKRQGHQVTAVTNLTAARVAASAALADFDLLISDIELPDGTGLELIRELNPQGIPGIALSGYGSAEDVRNSRAAGFALHLVKPVLAEMLEDAICKLPKTEDPTTPAVNATDGNPIADGSAGDHSNLLPPVSPLVR